jgi:hypothetical protein
MSKRKMPPDTLSVPSHISMKIHFEPCHAQTITLMQERLTS